MVDERAWLMFQISSRTRRHELAELLNASPGGHWAVSPMTKADMIKELNARRAAYWNARHAENLRPRPSATVRKSAQRLQPSSRLSAAECNAFLRSLPPLEPV